MLYIPVFNPRLFFDIYPSAVFTCVVIGSTSAVTMRDRQARSIDQPRDVPPHMNLLILFVVPKLILNITARLWYVVWAPRRQKMGSNVMGRVRLQSSWLEGRVEKSLTSFPGTTI